MSTPVLDQIGDTSGAELVRLSAFYQLPDFVKSAGSGKRLFDPPSTPGIYADVEHRLYPCHNPPSTWLSAMFFHDKRADYTTRYGEDCARLTEMRLNELARTWKIKTAVEAIPGYREQALKEAAAAPVDWAMQWTDPAGQVHQHLRLANPSEVKAAADWLQQYRDQVPVADRLTVAGRVLTKAAEWDVDLGNSDESLRRMAGQGICNPAEVVHFFRMRQKLASSTLQASEINKLADVIEAHPEQTLQPELLPELLKVAEEIDQKLGLVGKYTSIIRAPEDVIFSTTYAAIKHATDNSVALLTGGVYTKEALASLPLEQFRDIFGTDMANEVTSSGLDIDPVKMAEVAPTLPLPDARLLTTLLHDNGIMPVARMKSAALTPGQVVGLTADEAERLSAAY